MEKKQKRIRVEFEVSPQAIRELLEVGSRAPERLSDADIERLAEHGIIRASDFLDPSEQDIVMARIAKLTKLWPKAKSGLTSDKVKDKATSIATWITIDQITSLSMEETDETPLE